MATTKDFKQGHRERVRARFLREGLRPFQDYEVLELLLFYAVPRRDTKPIAHALIDKFGTLERVLCASVAELCTVEGVGKRTAEFLLSVFPFMHYVARVEAHTETYNEEKRLADYFYARFNKLAQKSSALVLLNNRNEIIRHLLLPNDSCISLINTGNLARLVYSYRASQVAFADYKANGIAFPEGTVMSSISLLRDELSALGIHMKNSLVVANGVYSSVPRLMSGGFVKSAQSLLVEPCESTFHELNEDSLEALIKIFSLVLPEEKANELSVSLLTKYGTLGTLLLVPHQTLVEENEEYASALLFLRIVSEVYGNAHISRIRAEKKIYRSARELGEMFCDAIGTNCEETVVLGLFDKDKRLIELVPCSHGSVNTASVVMRSVTELAIAYRAAYVAISHNHPSGDPIPTSQDLALTTGTRDALHSINVLFLDHFIVTERDAIAVSRHDNRHSLTDADDSFYE